MVAFWREQWTQIKHFSSSFSSALKTNALDRLAQNWLACTLQESCWENVWKQSFHREELQDRLSHFHSVNHSLLSWIFIRQKTDNREAAARGWAIDSSTLLSNMWGNGEKTWIWCSGKHARCVRKHEYSTNDSAVRPLVSVPSTELCSMSTWVAQRHVKSGLEPWQSVTCKTTAVTQKLQNIREL